MPMPMAMAKGMGKTSQMWSVSGEREERAYLSYKRRLSGLQRNWQLNARLVGTSGG